MITTKKGRIWITVTRFTQDTWEQRQRWQREHKFDGVVYPTPLPVSSKIPSHGWMFVLEMNNDYNQIEGISLLENTLWKMRVPVYANQNYNRYSYKTKWYKSRDEMTDDELETLEVLECLVFKGKTHVKRGMGISMFPRKFFDKYHRQFTDFFRCLFIEYDNIPCLD